MLVRRDLRIREVAVTLYDKNPATTNAGSLDEMTEKITVRDLALSVSNEDINLFLEFSGVQLTTDVRYARERDHDGKLTSYKNGERYAYAKAPVNPILPRSAYVAGLQFSQWPI
jgi:hypothetical protein